MQDYKKLKVWEKSNKIALDVYSLTAEFPVEEKYGITSQIRRAVISIPTNIAEGTGRGSNKDFNRFLHISMGSASEVDYLLLLAKDLKFFDQNVYSKISDDLFEVKKMLTGLIKKVK